jgi:peptidoglycan/LPS O-acetylase OafA/YrhL
MQTRLREPDETAHAVKVARPLPGPTESDYDSATPTRHRNDIQGLRAVAVLLVALSHAGVSVLRGGYVGVDVFFVLSGFLITGLLITGSHKPRPAAIVEFYVRRARRILPAATLTLIVTDLVANQMLNFVRAKEVLQDSKYAALFTANFHFAHTGTDYFARNQPPSAIQHFWSLSVEEQFYLLWPAVFSLLLLLGFAISRQSPGFNVVITERLLLPLRIAAIAIVGGSVAWSIHQTHTHPTSAYFSTFARFWELALGATLTLIAPRLVRLSKRWRTLLGWAGVAAIGIAAVQFSSSTEFPGYAALLPCLGAALVIAAGIARDTPRLAVGRILSLAPMRYIGDRSYAFYLWHWPVLIIAVEYAGHELAVWKKLLLLAGAFALSVVSYRFVENPLRRKNWNPPSGALWLWPASALSVLIVAGIFLSSINTKETQEALRSAKNTDVSLFAHQQTVKSTSAQPGSSSAGASLAPVAAAVKAAQKGGPIPSGLNPPVGQLINDHYNFPGGCATQDGQTSSRICRMGDPSGAKTVIIMGDSHAQMWMPALLSAAQKEGWAVIPLVKSGCTPERWIGHRGKAECHAWYRWAIGKARGLHPDGTLVTGNYSNISQGQTQTIANGIQAAVTSAKRWSKGVAVIADPPAQDRQPTDCLLSGHASMARCASAPSDVYLTASQYVSEVASGSHVGLLDTIGWFCFDDTCPLVVGHTITHSDADHVSVSYATALSLPFRSATRKALGL